MEGQQAYPEVRAVEFSSEPEAWSGNPEGLHSLNVWAGQSAFFRDEYYML
jgi:hypothetical protein